MAGSGSMMEHGDVAWGPVTPAGEPWSSAQPGGGDEPMAMFLSEVDGPESQEHFGQLFAEVVFPQLSNLEVIAGAWAEWGHQDRYIIHGWAKGDPVTPLAGVLSQLGWRARTRVFSGLPGLPNPRQQLAMCQMPNNLHVVQATDVTKSCQQRGHTFTDHKITRCVIDGSLLV